MYIFAGLGNPGQRYTENRHNIGSSIIDEILRRYDFASFRTRVRLAGDLAEGKVDGVRVVLLKPTTFMNESGRSVGATMRYFKSSPDELCIFHDELDLSLGKVRMKLGGSSAGHNGLKSVDANVGSDYWRVRVGIGRPCSREDVEHYVLSDFSRNDVLWLKKVTKAIVDSVPLLLAAKPNDFMTRIASLAPPSERMKASSPINDEEQEDGV